MADACDNNKKAAVEINAEAEKREAEAKKILDKKFPVSKKILDKVNDYIETNYSASYITSEQFNQVIKDNFGKEQIREELALRIKMLIGQNLSYAQFAEEMIRLNLVNNPKGLKTYSPKQLLK